MASMATPWLTIFDALVDDFIWWRGNIALLLSVITLRNVSCTADMASLVLINPTFETEKI